MSSVLAGAAGFLVKDATGPEIIDAIRQVAAGNSLLDPPSPVGSCRGMQQRGPRET